MKKITVKQLIKLKACENQVKVFKKLFGDSTTVTVKKCVKYACKFDWDWAAKYMLSAKLWRKYDRQKNLLLKKYDRQIDLLWSKYERQRDLLSAKAEYGQWLKYERQRGLLWSKYEREENTLGIEYEQQRAQLWANLYLKEV